MKATGTDRNIIEIMRQGADAPVERMAASADDYQVRALLDKQRLAPQDLPALLSDAAGDHLEKMAQRAAASTRRFFGNAIFIFTPLYISNHCENACPYCSFSRCHAIVRKHLTYDQIEIECARIAETGIRHILILTGEARSVAGPDYLCESVDSVARHFSAIGIEVYPMTRDEYARCIGRGVDALTIYQETYNESLYRTLHAGGPKADYAFRLEAPDRACLAGMRGVTIGPLLGLSEFVREAWCTALHLQYLQRHYPEVELSVSFPRIRPLAGAFEPRHLVGERKLAQLITAFRLIFPSVGITLSTRESARFRDGAAPLGITRMSAGVSTAVGGHSGDPSTSQFEIADPRDVAQVMRDLSAMGLQPVMHDWHKCLVRPI